MDLKTIVERNDTTAGRYFDLSVQLLIFVSIVTFSIETLPNIDSGTQVALGVIESVIVILFTIEYLLRIYVSDKKLSYVLSFYGLIDLAAILPFYLSTGLDLRSLRIFRLLRLFRLLKILRYNKAIDRFFRAYQIAKEEIVLFVTVTLMLLYLSAVGIYYFENSAQPEAFSSVFSSLWWAVTTLSTVGYGDVYPITLGGRLFTFVILMIGLGIVAVPAGLLASALSKARMDETNKEG
ncbi:ion transporter [Sedimenticola selenatireducens]|uniref:Ion transporter n=1 Tax=Sedimenticola selenatireducens TaxID=191960 RepID=A0A2N6CR95_9GAMM|nr:ion transporter [Sedimenticola selenatireducens]PLX59583.1 MAG: ion transporter [Sedimenticola selenatireducens]